MSQARARSTVVIALALAVGFGVGFALARWVVVEQPYTAIVPEDGGERRPSSAGGAAGANPECPDTVGLERQIASLKEQRDALATMLNDLNVDYGGEWLDWPEEVAPQYAEAGFIEKLHEAMTNCGSRAEVTRIDCDEPPCLASLRVPEDDYTAYNTLVSKCPTWVEAYGKTTTTSSGIVECPDGSKERYLLVGVPADAVLGTTDDIAVTENRSKRFQSRVSEIKRDWQCAAP